MDHVTKEESKKSKITEYAVTFLFCIYVLVLSVKSPYQNWTINLGNALGTLFTLWLIDKVIIKLFKGTKIIAAIILSLLLLLRIADTAIIKNNEIKSANIFKENMKQILNNPSTAINKDTGDTDLNIISDFILNKYRILDEQLAPSSAKINELNKKIFPLDLNMFFNQQDINSRLDALEEFRNLFDEKNNIAQDYFDHILIDVKKFGIIKFNKRRFDTEYCFVYRT